MFFTRSQQRAFIIVAVISIVSFTIRFAWQNQSYQHDFSEFHARFLSRLDSIRQSEKVDSVRLVRQAQERKVKQPESLIFIDPNTASAAELQRLPGIGEIMATRIISHRQKHDPFRKAEDLLIIKGIGKKSLKKIRGYLKFGER